MCPEANKTNDRSNRNPNSSWPPTERPRVRWKRSNASPPPIASDFTRALRRCPACGADPGASFMEGSSCSKTQGKKQTSEISQFRGAVANFTINRKKHGSIPTAVVGKLKRNVTSFRPSLFHQWIFFPINPTISFKEYRSRENNSLKTCPRFSNYSSKIEYDARRSGRKFSPIDQKCHRTVRDITHQRTFFRPITSFLQNWNWPTSKQQTRGYFPLPLSILYTICTRLKHHLGNQ